MYSTSKQVLIEKIRYMKQGFTLIEILIVVLIIGILGAIMLPQYQRAVLKSRYAALMPIAKSLADSNEVYFLDNGEYADNAQDLLIQGQRNYPDGTKLEFGTTTSHAYVLATRGEDFPNHYIVYQKHSEQFPGEIHCEADSTNDMAQEVCKSFGATDGIGEILTEGFTTYVLSGTGHGAAPSRCPSGATCDESGNIKECPGGQTLHNGSCGECDIPYATQCSTTEYKATACSTGYTPKNGTCEQVPLCGGNPQPAAQTEPCGNGYTSGNKTLAATCENGSWKYIGNWNTDNCSATQLTAEQAQTFANQNCINASGNPAVNSCTGIANEDGSVTVCVNQWTTTTPEGDCVAKAGSVSRYKAVFNPDGTLKQQYSCDGSGADGCFGGSITTYNGGTGSGNKIRKCANNAPLSNDFTCPNNQYDSSISKDASYDSHGNSVTSNYCSVVNSQGECTAYSKMYRWENTYDGDTLTSQVRYKCTSISSNGTECNTWIQW